jgi:hypothetical protein
VVSKLLINSHFDIFEAVVDIGFLWRGCTLF